MNLATLSKQKANTIETNSAETSLKQKTSQQDTVSTSKGTQLPKSNRKSIMVAIVKEPEVVINKKSQERRLFRDIVALLSILTNAGNKLNVAEKFARRL